MPDYTLLEGDCLESLKMLADNSVDAVVTDPPYGIRFMGKAWDGADIEARVKARRSSSSTPPAYVYNERGGQVLVKKPSDSPFCSSATEAGAYDFTSKGMLAFQEFTLEYAHECLRVLKPGGHLASFSSTRTQHRMIVAIEDAGFEIRDCCAWITGQGFPKSLNVSKKLESLLPADAQCACDLDCLQTAPDYRDDCSSCSDPDDEQLLSDQDSDQAPFPSLDDAQIRILSDPHEGDWAEVSERTHSGSGDHHANDCFPSRASSQSEDSQAFDSGQFGISSNTLSVELMAGHKSPVHTRDKLRSDDGLAVSSRAILSEQYPNIPRCPKCGKLKIVNGLGTALKPAWEMICLARKPLSEKTVAANVLRWGTGAINIDATRIGVDENDANHRSTQPSKSGDKSMFGIGGVNYGQNAKGRFPANLCHDGSDEVLDLFPETKSGSGNKNVRNRDNGNTIGNGLGKGDGDGIGDDSGSAARFFYCAKASKGDRTGSKHPTIKPVKLMQWLCRLICPPGGVILDPFAGSGTTGLAARLEGFRSILCEQEAEYIADIRNRMDETLTSNPQDVRAPEKAQISRALSLCL